MPELPDVEIFKQYVDATALHQAIKDIDVRQSKILDKISIKDFTDALKGKSFSETRRHGKHLFIKAGRQVVQMHFGMTGSLKYFKGDEDDLAHVRLVFFFTKDYRLAYRCQRMLGRVGLEDSIDAYLDKKSLGPDALAMHLSDFKNAAQQAAQPVKAFLMDQKKIAGLGNIYTDEVLFQSGIHPKTAARDLDDKQLDTIHKNMRKVCEYAVRHKADPSQFGKSWLLPNRRKGADCPKCGGKLKQIKISGRTAYLCPECQPTG